MKKILLFVATSLLFVSCSEKYDDTALRNEMADLANRVAKLEQLCQQLNTNIGSLQTIVAALQQQDYITAVSPINEGGKVIGYTVTFAKNGSITIYHGEDGKDGQDGANGNDGVNGADGKDGATPQIGVKQDDDGVYYWTLNGEWLTDENGNKIKAEGSDGKDGQDGTNGNDGQDGQNGQDGKDGITPQLKIEDEYWYISYDNGISWTRLGKATGEDGKDGQNGENGTNGDSFFQSVDTSNDAYVVFTLIDGTVLTVLRVQGTEVSANIPNNEIWYVSTDGQIIIPYSENFGAKIVSNTYNGKGVITFDGDVTMIGDDAFRWKSKLSQITIPQSVTSIGQYAFQSTALEICELDDSITSIGKYAFGQCQQLTEIKLPKYLKHLSDQVFQSCKMLKKVKLNDNLITVGNSAFAYCAIEELVVPDKVQIIEKFAFFCDSLKRIELGNGIIRIGEAAFGYDHYNHPKDVYIEDISSWCSIDFEGSDANPIAYGNFYLHNDLVVDLILPTKTHTISYYAFQCCNSLKSVTIPSSVKTIGIRPFLDCSNLTKVYCEAYEVPEAAGSWVGNGANFEWNAFPVSGKCTIYVPKQSLTAYTNANGWKDYKSYMVGR